MAPPRPLVRRINTRWAPQCSHWPPVGARLESDSPQAPQQILARALDAPTPTLPESFPRDLAAALQRAMARDPQNRYPDLGAFAVALANIEHRLGHRPTAIPIAGIDDDATIAIDKDTLTALRQQTATPTAPLSESPAAAPHPAADGPDAPTIAHTSPQQPPAPPPPGQPPRRRPKRRRRILLVALALLLAAAATTTALLLTRPTDTTEPPQPPPPAEPAKPAATEPPPSPVELDPPPPPEPTATAESPPPEPTATTKSPTTTTAPNPPPPPPEPEGPLNDQLPRVAECETPAPPLAPPPVTDESPWLVNDDPELSGPQEFWYPGTVGHGYGANDYLFTYGIGGETRSENSARWYMGNATGRQEIQVYVPTDHATATVNYTICIGNSHFTVLVPQRSISGWHSLGEWDTNGTNVVISISDIDAIQNWKTDGAALSRIGVDAIRTRCVANCSEETDPGQA